MQTLMQLRTTSLLNTNGNRPLTRINEDTKNQKTALSTTQSIPYCLTTKYGELMSTNKKNLDRRSIYPKIKNQLFERPFADTSNFYACWRIWPVLTKAHDIGDRSLSKVLRMTRSSAVARVGPPYRIYVKASV